MPNKLRKLVQGEERGQVLILFALGLVVMLGFVAMSIDVGRLVWARTSIQAGVDAAALAAAQSMPDQSAAQSNATTYWTKNSGFIQSNGHNINFTVDFPAGNKAVTVHADAQVDTWFAKLFGVDHWTVGADGDAASQVLDVAVVLDISQSMCDDSYPRVDQRPNMSPGQGTVPKLSQAVDASSTVLKVSDVTPFLAAVSNYMPNPDGWAKLPAYTPTSGPTKPTTSQYTDNSGVKYTNANTPYWLASPQLKYGGLIFTMRPGLIMLGVPATAGTQATGELMQITSIDTVNKTLTVIRGVNDKRGSQTDPTYAGVPTAKTAHPANQEIWMDRNGRGCPGAAPTASGPYQPFDETINDAQFFAGLFSSYDKMGFAYFSSTATLSQALTGNMSTVKSAMGSTGAPGGGTNTAHGLAVGRQILDRPEKRANAVRVEVLITDGRAKEYCGTNGSPNGYKSSNYDTTACPGAGGGIEGNTTANYAAEQETIRLTNPNNEDIILFVIGLGAGADKAWLRQLADGGVAGVGPCQNNKPGCRYYDAPTTSQLQSAFADIAKQSHIALVK